MPGAVPCAKITQEFGEETREAHLSTQQARAQASPRLPCAHGDPQRPQDHRCPPRPRPQASVRLTAGAGGARPIVDQLRKRRDFLAAAKAERAGVSAFLLQGRDRGDGGEVRIGFTVTKKTGNAVVRNRIRRRLREVARQVVPQAGYPGFDYVLVAREQALAAPFGSLLSDLGKALRKLHDPARATRSGKSQRASHGGSPSGGQRRGRSANASSHAPDPKMCDPGASPQGPSQQGAAPQGIATASGRDPHFDPKTSSEVPGSDSRASTPQVPSADGGHSA